MTVHSESQHEGASIHKAPLSPVGQCWGRGPIPLGDPEQDNLFSQVMLGAYLRVVASLK